MTNVLGYGIASFYHAVGFLALLVAISFTLDAWRRHNQDGPRKLLKEYLQSWADWARKVPRDFGVLLGRVEALPDQAHPYGQGYPLQVGIAHTAWAWAGMAFYWSEKNIAWMGGLTLLGSILPFVWTALYGRGYMMHLQTIWVNHPHRWRLLLLGMVLYVPIATVIRASY